METVGSILAKKGSTEVFSMVADESVLNAARLMNERGVGCVVVTDEGNMIGIFTERDILRRVVAEQKDARRHLHRRYVSRRVRRRDDLKTHPAPPRG
jgi:CBS domain-containing protein